MYTKRSIGNVLAEALIIILVVVEKTGHDVKLYSSSGEAEHVGDKNSEAGCSRSITKSNVYVRSIWYFKSLNRKAKRI